MRLNSFLYFVIVLLVWSCKKDTPPKRPDASGTISASKRLIICNEGDFGFGNASVSVYDPVSESTVYDVYGANNSSQSMGDVLQSVGFFNEKYYWIVNNSSKIIITDKNFVLQKTVTNFISPRYITFVSNNKAYVTNLRLNGGVNYIQVLDLNTNTISKTIRVDGWTEQLVESYGKVYVANQRKNYVYVISTANDLVVDSIFVNGTSACIAKDQNEKLWVSCNGDSVNNVNARLVRINPLNDQIEADISLGTTKNSISRLCLNGNGDMLYFLMSNLYRMPLSATAIPAPFIQQGARTFYGICVDPDDETIYVSDAVDYLQDGTILRYGPDGTLQSTFKAGLVPGFMRME